MNTLKHINKKAFVGMLVAVVLITPFVAKAVSIADLQVQISNLFKIVVQLRQQLAGVNGSVPQAPLQHNFDGKTGNNLSGLYRTQYGVSFVIPSEWGVTRNSKDVFLDANGDAVFGVSRIKSHGMWELVWAADEKKTKERIFGGSQLRFHYPIFNRKDESWNSFWQSDFGTYIMSVTVPAGPHSHFKTKKQAEDALNTLLTNMTIDTRALEKGVISYKTRTQVLQEQIGKSGFFDNAEYGFSFKLPKGWVYEENGTRVKFKKDGKYVAQTYSKYDTTASEFVKFKNTQAEKEMSLSYGMVKLTDHTYGSSGSGEYSFVWYADLGGDTYVLHSVKIWYSNTAYHAFNKEEAKKVINTLLGSLTMASKEEMLRIARKQKEVIDDQSAVRFLDSIQNRMKRARAISRVIFPTSVTTPRYIKEMIGDKRNLPVDFKGRFNEYHWINNTRTSSHYCMYYVFKQPQKGKYYYITQANKGYTDIKPTTLFNCGGEQGQTYAQDVKISTKEIKPNQNITIEWHSNGGATASQIAPGFTEVHLYEKRNNKYVYVSPLPSKDARRGAYVYRPKIYMDIKQHLYPCADTKCKPLVLSKGKQYAIGLKIYDKQGGALLETQYIDDITFDKIFYQDSYVGPQIKKWEYFGGADAVVANVQKNDATEGSYIMEYIDEKGIRHTTKRHNLTAISWYISDFNPFSVSFFDKMNTIYGDAGIGEVHAVMVVELNKIIANKGKAYKVRLVLTDNTTKKTIYSEYVSISITERLIEKIRRIVKDTERRMNVVSP